MADHSSTSPDYALEDSLFITESDQYKALFEPTRQQIVQLLLERAATTAELAEALGKPKGTVGHHLKTLERAGLVTVVRTEQVRALTAKFYGRTARVFYFQRQHDATAEPGRTASRVAEEASQVPENTDLPAELLLRYARISPERAHEWQLRLHELIKEFSAQPREGETTFAFTAGIFPTERRPLGTSAMAEEPEGRSGD